MSESSSSSSSSSHGPTSGRGGLGYESRRSSSSSLSSLDRSGLPSTFGGSRARKRRRTNENGSEEQILSVEQEETGEWEKHTRGIGSRILKSQGFRGRLGKRESGIRAPVEPVRLQAGRGLGAGKKGKGEGKKIMGRRETERTEHVVKSSKSSEIIEQRRNAKRERDMKEEEEWKEQRERMMRQGEAWEWSGGGIYGEIEGLRRSAWGRVTTAKQRVEAEKLISEVGRRNESGIQRELHELRERMDTVGGLEEGLHLLTDGKHTIRGLQLIGRGLSCTRGLNLGLVRRGVTEVICELVSLEMRAILASGGRRRGRELGRLLLEVRGSLGEESWQKVVGGGVVGAVRGRMRGWDAVREAWVGDVVAEVCKGIGEAGRRVLADDVVCAVLGRRVDREIREGRGAQIDRWVFAWGPVIGKHGMKELAERVRKWSRPLLAKGHGRDVVRKWAAVWGAHRVRRMVERDVGMWVDRELRKAGTNAQQVEKVLCEISAWGELVQMEWWIRRVSEGVEQACRAAMLHTVTEQGWEQGRDVYKKWRSGLGEMASRFRPELAVCLWVLHVGRLDKQRLFGRGNDEWRALGRNRFQKHRHAARVHTAQVVASANSNARPN